MTQHLLDHLQALSILVTQGFRLLYSSLLSLYSLSLFCKRLGFLSVVPALLIAFNQVIERYLYLLTRRFDAVARSFLLYFLLFGFRLLNLFFLGFRSRLFAFLTTH